MVSAWKREMSSAANVATPLENPIQIPTAPRPPGKASPYAHMNPISQKLTAAKNIGTRVSAQCTGGNRLHPIGHEVAHCDEAPGRDHRPCQPGQIAAGEG